MSSDRQMPKGVEFACLARDALLRTIRVRVFGAASAPRGARRACAVSMGMQRPISSFPTFRTLVAPHHQRDPGRRYVIKRLSTCLESAYAVPLRTHRLCR